jgi:polysaccharide biosynthesis transport protein
LSEPSRAEGVDLRSVLAVLRRRAGLIGLITVLTAAVALGFSLLQNKEYSTSASLLFRNSGLDAKLFGVSVSTSDTDPTRQAETNLKLISLEVVAARTAGALNGALTAADVQRKVHVSTEGESDVVSINATDASPAVAARLANTFGREYIDIRQAADRGAIHRTQNLVKAKLDALPASEQSSPLANSLQKRLDDLGVLGSLQTGNAELVQKAQIPSTPSSPKPKRNAIFGAFGGLLLGFALALVWEQFDRRLRSPEELGEALGMPVLGTVPESQALVVQRWLEGRDGAQLHALPPSEAEAFRMLRANLRYFDVKREIRTVLVTSPTAEDGKSTVALNLALAAAESGMSVLLLEADMRHPSLASTLGIGRDGGGPGLGLDSLLTNPDTALSDVSQGIQVATRTSGDASPGNLYVVMAGAIPPNPTELMESDRMRGLLSEAKRIYDLIVIDTPPILAVSDAIPLVKQVDGVLVVGRLASTTREHATRLRDQLERLDVPTLGVVANFAHEPERYYAYGHKAPAWRMSSSSS